jgi:hypothetical protein
VLFNDGNNQAPSHIGFDVVNGGYYTTGGLDHIILEATTSVRNTPAQELSFHSNKGILFAESTVEGKFPVYSVTGTLVRILNIKRGKNAFYGLSSGLYIIKQQKVIVK